MATAVKMPAPVWKEVVAAIPKVLPQPGVLSFYLITPGYPITDSQGQKERVFYQNQVWVGNVDTTKYQLFLSSLPDTPAPIIVDDGLFVNGAWHGGFTRVTTDPKQHLGENPSVCYTEVEPIDVTNDVRKDGWIYFQLMDIGGYTYCASRLYLIVHPR